MSRQGAAIAGLALAILAGALVCRFAELDRIVTPDEPLWITRAARFDRALTEGRFDDTFQAVHPGVTLMWGGTVAYELLHPTVPAMVPGPESLGRQADVHKVLEAGGVDALAVLVDLRRAAILLNAAILIAALWLFGQAVGGWPALCAGALIAAEPLHVATSRLLHLDALTAGLLLLAAVAVLRYLQTNALRYLVVGGSAAALAWLTRASALYLAAWTGAVLALAVLRALPDPARRWTVLRAALRRGAVWGAAAAVVTVACWPALWVAPVATIDRAVAGSLSLATDAHSKQIFFRGQVWLDDPGWSFYPASFLWRTTPVVLVGLGLAAAAAILPGRGRLDHRRRLAVAYLALFGLGYLLLLGLGAKKIDRYVLPVVLVADALAAIGWWWLATRVATSALSAQTAPRLRATALALAASAVGIQAGLAAASAPYYLTYYNPLLGGLAGARSTMMIGWGEGFDQAGAWLNAQPGAEELRVTAGPWPVALDYFFVGDVIHRDHSGARSGPVAEWLTTDFAVVSFAEVQRRLVDPAYWSALQAVPPATVIRLAGEEMIWIYDLRDRPPPEELYHSSPVAFEWDTGLRLLATSAGNRDIVAGESVRLSFWLHQPANPAGRLALRGALVHPETGARFAAEIEIPPGETSKGATLAERRVKTPATATPGTYRICVQAVYPDGGPVIPGHSPDGTRPATEICGGVVEILPAA